jgi:PKD repeat protein
VISIAAFFCLLPATTTEAAVNTRYGEVERFGGFDESAYNGGHTGGTLTPGKLINPRGFAVDTQDATGGAQSTALYVVERATLGTGEEHTSWMVQKLGEKGTVLATKTFTLANGKFEDLAVEGLAVDHASKRLYALVVGGQPPAEIDEPVAHELVAWSTEPSGKELVAPAGLAADTLGTGAGVVATTAQLDSEGFLYEPQGIAVDQNVANHPVAIEATDANGDKDGTIVNGGNPGGNTIVQLVATASGKVGELLKPRWSSESAASQLENTSWGPGGIATSPDGSLLVTLNNVQAGGLGYAVDLSGSTLPLTATVLAAPQSLPPAGDYDQRPYTGLGAPFGNAGVGQGVSNAKGAGAQIVQLSTSTSSTEGGLYAALFAPTRSEDPQTGRQLLYFHTGPLPSEKAEGEKIYQGNLGVRLLQTGGGGSIIGPQGETIVNTLGNPTEEAACNFDSFETMTFAAGSMGVMWVLEQGPDAVQLAGLQLANAATGGQIVELAPLGEGVGEGAAPCPQSEGTFTMQPAGGSSASGETEITVAAGTTVKFDATGLNVQGGVPFAYEWQLDSEDSLLGKPINSIASPTYAAPPATAEYTYTKVGTYKVKLTLLSDYGAYTTKEGTVKVTAGISPTARFAVSTPAPEVGVAVSFDATESQAGSGVIEHYRWSWGDGTEEQGGPEKIKLTHTYAESKSYEVKLTVINSLGLESVYEQNVIVAAKKEPEVKPEPKPEPKPEAKPEPKPEPKSEPDRSATNVSPHANNANGSVKAQVSCPPTKSLCAGTVTIETANAVASSKKSVKHKKRMVIGHASFSLAGGQSQTLTVQLSSAGVKLLRTLKRLPILVLVSAHDAFGDLGTQSVKVTLTSHAAKKSVHGKKH